MRLSPLYSGMEVYPIRASFLEFVPQPLLAGVLGGVCFLFLAIVLALVAACLMSQRRHKRRAKRRHGEDNKNGDMDDVALLWRTLWYDVRSTKHKTNQQMDVLNFEMFSSLPWHPQISILPSRRAHLQSEYQYRYQRNMII